MKPRRFVLKALFPVLILCGCAAEKERLSVEPSAQTYFQESYEECRARFRSLAGALEKTSAGGLRHEIPVASRSESELSLDLLYLPARQARERLLILSSGVHGIEGFAGSAVQQMFLREILPQLDTSRMGVLLIHGLNPHGFKHFRRVTENNVDLNRNCDVDRALFSSGNEGYAKLSDFLNPEERVSLGFYSGPLFFARAMLKILQASMGSLRQAILQGQYQFPRGLYYGGQDFEPQITALRPLLEEILAGYTMVLTIDLHTGYGERNRLHLFPNPVAEPQVRQALERVFENHPIDWGDKEGFYTVTGDFVGFIGKLAPGSLFLPMVFEYGTLDSQTTRGAIRSIHNMILENQGFHYGYEDSGDEREVKRRMREMYLPSSPEWRSEVIRQARELLPSALGRFQALNPTS